MLLVCRSHVSKDIENVVLNFTILSCHGPIHLVDHNQRLHLLMPERLLKNELRLGLRTLYDVHQKDDAVHHGEYSLHFSPEVCVAGSVYDVEYIAIPWAGL